MKTKFKSFNMPLDTSGSMGSNTKFMQTKTEIWEIDDSDNEFNYYTGNKLDISFNELKILMDNNLVFIKKGDYVYSKNDYEKINNILELERDTNKYNL